MSCKSHFQNYIAIYFPVANVNTNLLRNRIADINSVCLLLYPWTFRQLPVQQSMLGV